MELNLNADLSLLAQHAFQKPKQQAALLQDIHCLLAKSKHAHAHESLYLLRTWLLKAWTLWTPDIIGLAEYVCDQLRTTNQIEPKLRSVLTKLQAMPDEQVHEIISDTERAMSVGDFDWCLTDSAKAKFLAAEKQTIADPRLRALWEEMKLLHNVEEWRNPKGILRRRMNMERNFRSLDSKFKWETDRDKFQLDFDLLCANFCLHGYEGEKPLLQKLCVYPTSRSVVIDVPRYWSLDYRRDLRWPAINALLRVWGMLRQGEKMSLARAEREELKRLAKILEVEARKQRIKGEARYAYIAKRLALPPGTDERVIRRLLEG